MRKWVILWRPESRDKERNQPNQTGRVSAEEGESLTRRGGNEGTIDNQNDALNEPPQKRRKRLDMEDLAFNELLIKHKDK